MPWRFLWVVTGLALAGAGVARGQEADPADSVVWKKMHASVFANAPLEAGADAITLDTPKRAEDAAIVPVAIRSHFPQTKEPFIESSASAGKNALASKANLGKMHIRVNEPSGPGQPTLAQLMISHPEVDFSISENPNFRFYFVPDGGGQPEAKVLDNQKLEFATTVKLDSVRGDTASMSR